MKKLLLFLGGVITGVALMLVINLLTHHTKNESSKDSEPAAEEVTPDVQENLSLAELMFGEETEPGETFNEKSLEVFQVILDNAALAFGKNEFGDYYGMLYLLLGDDETTFFDKQIVKIPNNKALRMVGTYQYETNNGSMKTVPKVRIMDKE